MRFLNAISRPLRQPIFLFPLLGLIIGAGIGYAYTLISLLQGLSLNIALAASFGLILGIIFGGISNRRFGNLILEDVQVNIPHISTMKFVVNAKYREVSWKLFIETITRISTQPLAKESGFLREALESLYSIFNTTRELIQLMEPSGRQVNGRTVELLAVDMLNKELRPFLSNWHPRLARFETAEPKRPESEWEYNEAFRNDLEQLRIRLLNYAYGFGQLADLRELEAYFPDGFLEQNKGG